MPTTEEKFRATIEAVAKETGGRPSVYRNPDGSLDGEVLVPVERGQDPLDKVDLLERALARFRLPKNTFLATGFRFPPSEGQDPTSYDRYRGLFQLFSNFQYRPSYPVAFVTTSKQIDGIRGRGFRKPQQILLRFHWNPEGVKPMRHTGER